MDNTPNIGKKLEALHNQVHYLHNPLRIQAAAMNLAVATYGEDAKYVIRMDAHADYPNHYCVTLIDEAEKTKAASIVVSMQTVGLNGFQRAVAVAQNSRFGNGGSAHRNAVGDGAWVDHGHHALMCIDAFCAVGGYDENFSHNEDAELDIRLRKAGYKIWLTGRTSLTYYPRTTSKSLFKQYFSFGKGRARTLLKHKIKPRLRQTLPVFVAPSALLALLSPFVENTAIPLLCWTVLCLGVGAWLAVKHRDSNVIMCGPSLMIMHMAWSLGFWDELNYSYIRARR
jgi:succinoglycan biosynthesis protein ExoA